VRVLDDHIDYEKEHAYIVMELLDGETARQRIERAGPFEPLQAVELVMDLCDCLRAAHSAQVVHRDIKPENLFLTKEGLKVLDFGIARALDASSSLTQTGASLGTPAYMSPEQARGKQREITPRSDIYSVGATLLFLLSAETLHEGESPMELMVRAAWTPPPRAKKRCPSLPDPIAEVIDRCCAFDPNDRYADADAVITALEAVYRRLSSAPPPARQRVLLAPPETDSAETIYHEHLAETLDATLPVVPVRRQRWQWLLIPAAALLGLLWMLGRPSQESDAPLAEPSFAPTVSNASAFPIMAGAVVPEPTEHAPLFASARPSATESPRAPRVATSEPARNAGTPREASKLPPPATVSESKALLDEPEVPPPPPAAPARSEKSSMHIDIDYSNVKTR
jgi:serine/threonine-protein kinase